MISFVFNRHGRIRVRDGCGFFLFCGLCFEFRCQFFDALPELLVFVFGTLELGLDPAQLVFCINQIAAHFLLNLVRVITQVLISCIQGRIGVRRKELPKELLDGIPPF